MNAGERFTAIVVNYNGGALLSACAQSLLAAGLPPERLLVIDNGSKDDSIERLMASVPCCQVERMGCNAGFARAVNRGLARVKSEFALLFNNDARLAPDALEALAAAFDNLPRAAFLGGRLLHQDGRLQNAFAPFPTLLAEIIPKGLLRQLAPSRYAGRTQGEEPLRVESLIGALFAVRMAAVEDFGPLDEDFFFFLEETEWCHRAHRHGWHIWHIPQARAVHLQGATAKRYPAPARIEFQRSKLLYFAKTQPRAYPLALSLLFLKAMSNALAHLMLLAMGGILHPSWRARAIVYAHILAWYLAGRPKDVGLPDKCPQN